MFLRLSICAFYGWEYCIQIRDSLYPFYKTLEYLFHHIKLFRKFIFYFYLFTYYLSLKFLLYYIEYIKL